MQHTSHDVSRKVLDHQEPTASHSLTLIPSLSCQTQKPSLTPEYVQPSLARSPSRSFRLSTRSLTLILAWLRHGLGQDEPCGNVAETLQVWSGMIVASPLAFEHTT